jgi:hypothetical protein
MKDVVTGVRATVAMCCLCLFAEPVCAQMVVTQAKDVEIVYADGTESYLLPYAARTFLNSLAFQKKLFDYTPWEDITVLLADFEDSGNASTTAVPRNTVMVQIAPLNSAFETIAGNDRMNIIMNHELVHVAEMDAAAPVDRFFRRLFSGKVAPIGDQPESILYFYFTSPRVAAPQWYHEGIATFLDTWMAGGLGRAQGGYDEMVFRAMVKENARLYDPLGLASEGVKIDFQLQINSYLYGTRFMVWLARTYSPEKVIEWVTRRRGTRAYYAAQFRQVFGISIEEAWRRWLRDERAFQEQNLAAIHRYPTTPSVDLTSRTLGSVSRAFYDSTSRTIYAALNYPGIVAHIAAISIDTGDVRRIVDVKGPAIYTVAALARDPDTGLLFYTTDNHAHRDLVLLDPATNRTHLLQKAARIGDLAFDRADKSLWGVRQLNGLCTLVRIPKPYDEWKQVQTFPYGTVMYDVDVSPDGSRLVASFGEIDGRRSVRVLSVEALERGDVTPIAQFDFGTAVPDNFVFSPDGRFVYGSSYYTGVSNIFRYEIASKTLEAVSNADTGLFRPIPFGGDDLIVFRYSGTGFVPARIVARPLQDVSAITFLGERLVEEHPVIKTWSVGSPANVPWDSMPNSTRRYRLAGHLRTESIYPILQGYKDSRAVGARANFSDGLQLNRLSVSAVYSVGTDLPDGERLHAVASYDRYDWRARVAYNEANFYDLFGPTKVGRKGYAAGVGHKRLLVFDEPRRLDLDLSARVAGNIDRLPEYQNIAVNVNRLYTVEAKLSFADIRKSLGAVDDEAGQEASLALQNDTVAAKSFPRFSATYDRGFPLPLGHSSIWLRSAGGLAPGDRNDPFANFYFGAFGNNYVDHRNEKRYREFYAFPGLDLNAAAGRNFLKSMIEWNLPPVRFSQLGTPGFYATWLRPAVFAGGLSTNVDDAPARRTLTNAGAQLDLQLTMLSELNMTLSAGAAIAFDRSGGRHGEAMLSLKVLK